MGIDNHQTCTFTEFYQTKMACMPYKQKDILWNLHADERAYCIGTCKVFI